MIVYPNAKINIGLNVVEKRKDGYHNLETVFYPIPLLDALEVSVEDNTDKVCNIKVSGEILQGRPEDNLVVKTYDLLKAMFPQKINASVSIHLHKHIPIGAGLGGGSSDAAFMLKTLNQKFELNLADEEMKAIASKLGADCPFFIENKPVFAQGVGDIFSKIACNLSGKTLVLVKPDVFVSTKDAYSMVTPKMPDVHLPDLMALPLDQWKNSIKNDFETSVFRKYPEVAAIKDRLYDLGAVFASMSGSGSAVYGIFSSPLEYVDEIFSGYFCRQRTLE